MAVIVQQLLPREVLCKIFFPFCGQKWWRSLPLLTLDSRFVPLRTSNFSKIHEILWLTLRIYCSLLISGLAAAALGLGVVSALGGSEGETKPTVSARSILSVPEPTVAKPKALPPPPAPVGTATIPEHTLWVDVVGYFWCCIAKRWLWKSLILLYSFSHQ